MSAFSARPATEDVVKARDAAVLARLRVGPTSFEELKAILPLEPNQALSDREGACSSTVRRLHIKKLIAVVPEGYAIA